MSAPAGTSDYGPSPIAQSMRFMLDPTFPDDVLVMFNGLQSTETLRQIAWQAHKNLSGVAESPDGKILAQRIPDPQVQTKELTDESHT